MLAAPNESRVCRAIPWCSTSHGGSPSRDSSSATIPAEKRTSPPVSMTSRRRSPPRRFGGARIASGSQIAPRRAAALLAALERVEHGPDRRGLRVVRLELQVPRPDRDDLLRVAAVVVQQQAEVLVRGGDLGREPDRRPVQPLRGLDGRLVLRCPGARRPGRTRPRAVVVGDRRLPRRPRVRARRGGAASRTGPPDGGAARPSREPCSSAAGASRGPRSARSNGRAELLAVGGADEVDGPPREVVADEVVERRRGAVVGRERDHDAGVLAPLLRDVVRQLRAARCRARRRPAGSGRRTGRTRPTCSSRPPHQEQRVRREPAEDVLRVVESDVVAAAGRPCGSGRPPPPPAPRAARRPRSRRRGRAAAAAGGRLARIEDRPRAEPGEHRDRDAREDVEARDRALR